MRLWPVVCTLQVHYYVNAHGDLADQTKGLFDWVHLDYDGSSISGGGV